MNGLTLTLDSYSLEIPKRMVTQYDRRVVFYDGSDDAGTVERSPAGTSSILGSGTGLIWTITAFLTLEQWRVLQAMHSHQRELENNRQPFSITVADQIREQVDHGVRQRAIAPGTTETPVPGGGVAYYAQYLVRMGAPEGQPVKNQQVPWQVTWQQSETGVLTP